MDETSLSTRLWAQRCSARERQEHLPRENLLRAVEDRSGQLRSQVTPSPRSDGSYRRAAPAHPAKEGPSTGSPGQSGVIPKFRRCGRVVSASC